MTGPAKEHAQTHPEDPLQPTARSFRLAGSTAFLAGLAWLTWVSLNARTHGGLDAGEPAVSAGVARLGQLLIAAWNLLLLPAALVLQGWLGPRSPDRLPLLTLCGITSLLFWAYGGATHGITPALEVTYIALSGVWWLGLGLILWPTHRAIGALTTVLGVFAFWDAFLSGLESVPFALYLTASPKLPLSIVWDFALAVTLWREALAAPPSRPAIRTDQPHTH